MNKWSKSEKGLLFAVTLAAAVYVCGLDTKAMHIMEGYLPAGYCIAWGAVCLPFLAAGYLRIRKLVKEQKKALILLAMSGAFIFVISSLKIPSVTGSCSHMTGTGAWSHPVWAFHSQYLRHHRTGLSGGAFGPWRDHPRWEPTLLAWRLQDRFSVLGSISLASGLVGTGRQ